MHMLKVLRAVTHEQDIAANIIKALTLTRASCYVSFHKSLMLPGEHVSMLGNILREMTGKMNFQDSEAVLTGFVKMKANEKQSCH